MLSFNNYTQEYIDECRAKVNLQLSVYDNLITAAKEHIAAEQTPFPAALQSFEPHFFNHLVLALDHYFDHRSRTIEQKDGNPLNEVRMLCNSIMHNNNMMMADKTIKYKPDKTVLRYNIGDEISMDKEHFKRLAEAFFADISAKYL